MELEDLYKAALNGEQTARQQLFELLTARFRYFAQLKIDDSMDAEEIVQNSLMVVFEKYADIDITTSFSGWAHTILTNKIKEYYRTKAVHRRKLEEYSQGDSVRENSQDMAELVRQLKYCLQKLNEVNRRHARILNLNYQGFGVDEICRKFELTKSNLYSILSRARAALSDCLKKGDISR